MNKVLIMLSTYNGETYLRDQLNSLYAQKGVEVHILVRDDGSKDNTVEILKEYQQKFGKMTIREDVNVGAALSFHTLMTYAYEIFPDYNYYAFSDQDDVWFKDKLVVAIRHLSEKSGDLYYCNAIITNQDLNKIDELGCKLDLSLQYLMFRQPALGCTQVMTKQYFRFCTRLFKLYIMKKPPLIELHDVLTMWISQMVGAKVIVDNQPHILYRQHGNNVTYHKKERIIHKIKRVSKRSQNNKGNTYVNLQIIGELLKDQLTPNALDALNKMNNYQSSMFRTISFALYMQRYFNNISIKLMVMYRILNKLY